MPKPFLFPAPGSYHRGLLDFKASHSAEFTEDEATMDLMLAADRGDVKPIRYYVKRWGWTRYRVHQTRDALLERAAEWRRFYADPEGHPGQDSGQDQTDSGQNLPKTSDTGRFSDTVRQTPDSIEQIQNSHTHTHPRAREAVERGFGGLDGVEAVAVYAEVTGRVPTAFFAERIALAVLPRGTPTEDRAPALADWRSVCEVWAGSDYNTGNVPDMLDNYRRIHEQRQTATEANERRQAAGSGRRRRRGRDGGAGPDRQGPEGPPPGKYAGLIE